jgi:transposase
MGVISHEEYQKVLDENKKVLEEKKRVSLQNENLKNELFWLKKQVFGCKSEKRKLKERHPSEIDLFDTDADVPKDSTKDSSSSETITYTRKKRSKEQNRSALPETLPREEIIIELPLEERTCGDCGRELVEIGEEVSEELEIVPAKLFVKVTRVKKYACKQDSLHGVYKTRRPKRLIPKGIAGPQLLAHILISKYVDHLPLQRQEQMFKRLGHRISKQTMSDWLQLVCQKLDPLLECLKGKVLDSRILNGDETRYLVQQNVKRLKTINGWLWVYVGDHKWVWFEWHPGRSSRGLSDFVKGSLAEYFQCDGYAAYDKPLALYDIKSIACWAHARRNFFKEAEMGSAEAAEVVKKIAAIYAIEKKLKEDGCSLERIEEVRNSESRHLLEKLFEHLEQLNLTALPKGIGDACSYALKRKAQLMRYLDDAELDIDNNIAERTIRQVAVGRKNWLFSGSVEGAHFAAKFYSLIESCKLQGVDPAHYLTEVLKFLPDYEEEDMTTLLPDAYAMKYLE